MCVCVCVCVPTYGTYVITGPFAFAHRPIRGVRNLMIFKGVLDLSLLLLQDDDDALKRLNRGRQERDLGGKQSSLHLIVCL